MSWTLALSLPKVGIPCIPPSMTVLAWLRRSLPQAGAISSPGGPNGQPARPPGPSSTTHVARWRSSPPLAATPDGLASLVRT